MPSSISVLFSDDSILVVDKPAGMLSIPDRYDPDAPVASALLAKDWGRLYAVHRLDKDTSGVLVYARTAESHKALSESFEKRDVTKIYRAIVRGCPSWDETVCELPLKPDGDRLHRTVVDSSRGKSSVTSFQVLARYKDRGAFGGASLIEARPATGRTHQIRVHLASLGYPCICDPLYGDGKPLLLSKLKKRWKGDPFDERPLVERAALHALSAQFPHPATGEVVRFEAPLPKDLRAAISQLEKI
jgi:pseudouridine synthase, RluA family